MANDDCLQKKRRMLAKKSGEDLQEAKLSRVSDNQPRFHDINRQQHARAEISAPSNNKSIIVT